MELSTLEDLYMLALQDIKGSKGTITITIDGIPKISKSNDIIGNCVQEWIPQWLEDKGINLESNEHTQEFPDFTANIGGKKYDMEVKCWNYTNNPGFDLANFDGFYRQIFNDPRKLNARYLVFGYRPTLHGFEIVDIYLKNIWELTSLTKKYPVGLQIKQGKPYALRPYAFHKRPNDCFSSRREFVEAIQKARIMFPIEGMIDPNEWLMRVAVLFRELTGEDL
ncbi:NgoBV family restriction endonuclease [Bacillus cereus group sp. BcHK20]|uniref:NgoBV family restriction endonuclease n=1 Tax=Bacillus cereus group sp. BcHK20 TaxID=3018091 RepID=UPI0022E96DEB|nr:NgoBV family restriction endonuclease [Bacillus cereus group sp. BcHK20]MDA1904029.1 NgoBV family restriction endonuclease [Bacillus cereus group sp. BcHK20]